MAPVVAQAAGPTAAEVWEGLPLTAKREVVRERLEIEIVPCHQGIGSFDPTHGADHLESRLTPRGRRGHHPG